MTVEVMLQQQEAKLDAKPTQQNARVELSSLQPAPGAGLSSLERKDVGNRGGSGAGDALQILASIENNSAASRASSSNLSRSQKQAGNSADAVYDAMRLPKVVEQVSQLDNLSKEADSSIKELFKSKTAEEFEKKLEQLQKQLEKIKEAVKQIKRYSKDSEEVKALDQMLEKASEISTFLSVFDENKVTVEKLVQEVNSTPNNPEDAMNDPRKLLKHSSLFSDLMPEILGMGDYAQIKIDVSEKSNSSKKR